MAAQSGDRGVYVQRDTQQYVGTWERNGPNDSRATQRIILELRADGTYTKTLNATVDGKPYGGTHSGTWKARGTTVDLSGDGNWPSISHDLREFRKVR